MRWLGLDWDEGPEVGGPHAPYRQSQRCDIYADVARRLREAGHAYECFCTDGGGRGARDQAAGRDPARLRRPLPRPHRRAAGAAFRAEGREPVLRLRMPDATSRSHDLVRGE